MDRQWIDKIFNVDEAGFQSLAMELFHFQFAHNLLYREYCQALKRTPSRVSAIEQIPFLPIRFFKSNMVTTTDFEPEVVFQSSGTTGMINSRHLVRDAMLYRQSFLKGFGNVYGKISDYVILGLLPSYLERTGSSLVYMVDELIRQSNHRESGFYLHNVEELAFTLQQLEEKRQPTILIGVTFALLDFASSYPMELKHTIVMETGGMKGRRREIVRQEVQDILKSAFRVNVVHSEYGMTELLSQAYATEAGLFKPPAWMKILLRDEEDPFSLTFPSAVAGNGQTGAVNIIDLANIYSCCFIATDDAARLHNDGSFEILGRLDHSDLRGCSLLSL